MAGCLIPRTPIAVDYWRKRGLPRIHFLTHLHADHTEGLTSSWRQTIYCSEITRALAIAKFNLDPDVVVAIPIGQSTIIPLDDAGVEKMTVTLIDANHCAGAVMFLFQGYFGCILHTGDFRYCDGMLDIPPFTNNIVINTLYLDNTYCDPECEFPTKAEGKEKVLEIIHNHPDKNILFGLDTLGKEDLLYEVAKDQEALIVVDDVRYRTAELLGYGCAFTTNPQDSYIQVLGRRDINKHMLALLNQRVPTIGIIPTCRYKGLGSDDPFAKDDTIFVVPYSDHSSFSELKKFVAKLKPERIIPIVTSAFKKTTFTSSSFQEDHFDRADMTIFGAEKSSNKERHIFDIPPTVADFMSSYSKGSKRFGGLKRKASTSYFNGKSKRACGIVFSSPEKQKVNCTGKGDSSGNSVNLCLEIELFSKDDVEDLVKVHKDDDIKLLEERKENDEKVPKGWKKDDGSFLEIREENDQELAEVFKENDEKLLGVWKDYYRKLPELCEEKNTKPLDRKIQKKLLDGQEESNARLLKEHEENNGKLSERQQASDDNLLEVPKKSDRMLPDLNEVNDEDVLDFCDCEDVSKDLNQWVQNTLPGYDVNSIPTFSSTSHVRTSKVRLIISDGTEDGTSFDEIVELIKCSSESESEDELHLAYDDRPTIPAELLNKDFSSQNEPSRAQTPTVNYQKRDKYENQLSTKQLGVLQIESSSIEYIKVKDTIAFITTADNPKEEYPKTNNGNFLHEQEASKGQVCESREKTEHLKEGTEPVSSHSEAATALPCHVQFSVSGQKEENNAEVLSIVPPKSNAQEDPKDVGESQTFKPYEKDKSPSEMKTTVPSSDPEEPEDDSNVSKDEEIDTEPPAEATAIRLCHIEKQAVEITENYQSAQDKVFGAQDLCNSHEPQSQVVQKEAISSEESCGTSQESTFIPSSLTERPVSKRAELLSAKTDVQKPGFLVKNDFKAISSVDHEATFIPETELTHSTNEKDTEVSLSTALEVVDKEGQKEVKADQSGACKAAAIPFLQNETPVTGSVNQHLTIQNVALDKSCLDEHGETSLSCELSADVDKLARGPDMKAVGPEMQKSTFMPSVQKESRAQMHELQGAASTRKDMDERDGTPLGCEPNAGVNKIPVGSELQKITFMPSVLKESQAQTHEVQGAPCNRNDMDERDDTPLSRDPNAGVNKIPVESELQKSTFMPSVQSESRAQTHKEGDACNGKDMDERDDTPLSCEPNGGVNKIPVESELQKSTFMPSVQSESQAQAHKEGGACNGKDIDERDDTPLSCEPNAGVNKILVGKEESDCKMTESEAHKVAKVPLLEKETQVFENAKQEHTTQTVSHNKDDKTSLSCELSPDVSTISDNHDEKGSKVVGFEADKADSSSLPQEGRPVIEQAEQTQRTQDVVSNGKVFDEENKPSLAEGADTHTTQEFVSDRQDVDERSKTPLSCKPDSDINKISDSQVENNFRAVTPTTFPPKATSVMGIPATQSIPCDSQVVDQGDKIPFSCKLNTSVIPIADIDCIPGTQCRPFESELHNVISTPSTGFENTQQPIPMVEEKTRVIESANEAQITTTNEHDSPSSIGDSDANVVIVPDSQDDTDGETNSQEVGPSCASFSRVEMPRFDKTVQNATSSKKEEQLAKPSVVNAAEVQVDIDGIISSLEEDDFEDLNFETQEPSYVPGSEAIEKVVEPYSDKETDSYLGNCLNVQMNDETESARNARGTVSSSQGKRKMQLRLDCEGECPSEVKRRKTALEDEQTSTCNQNSSSQLKNVSLVCPPVGENREPSDSGSSTRKRRRHRRVYTGDVSFARNVVLKYIREHYNELVQ